MQHLEEQIAHLTRTVDELSDVISRQQGEIDRLTHRVAMLMERERARDQEGNGGVILGDERPPTIDPDLIGPSLLLCRNGALG